VHFDFESEVWGARLENDLFQECLEQGWAFRVIRSIVDQELDKCPYNYASVASSVHVQGVNKPSILVRNPRWTEETSSGSNPSDSSTPE
jgi:hypothetical protein